MQKTNSPTTKELRIFALVLAIGFVLIGAIIPYFRNRPFINFLLILASVIFVVGMISPKCLIYPRKIWIAIGNVMGLINSTIIFTIMYFLIFATVGLVFRIFKRDRMKSGFRKVNSTMVIKNEISTFEDPF